MSIALACPHCGKRFKVAESFAGKKGKCSGCGGVVKIPDAPAPPEPAMDLDLYGLDDKVETQTAPEVVDVGPAGKAPLEVGGRVASMTVEECSASGMVLACRPGRILLYLATGAALLIGGFLLATALEAGVERAAGSVRIPNLFVLIPYAMMGLGAASVCYLGRLGYRVVFDRDGRSFHVQRLYAFNRDWPASELGGIVFRTTKVGETDQRGNGTEQTADAFVLDRDGRPVALLDRVSSNKPKYVVPLAKAAVHAGRLLNLPVYVEQRGPVLRPDMQRAVQLIQRADLRNPSRPAPRFRPPLLTTYKAATIVMAAVMALGVSRFLLRYTWLGHKATDAAHQIAPGAVDAVLADNPLAMPAAGAAEARPTDPMEARLVDQWVSEMQSPDENKRRAAAFFLSGRDVVPDRREKVAEQFRRLNDSPDVEDRKRALTGLGRWGTDDDLTTLIDALQDLDRDVREAAGAGLVASKRPRAVDAFIERLRATDDRDDTANHLRRFGSGAESAVAKLLDDPDDSLKLSAASILENIGTRDSIPAIQAAVDRIPQSDPAPNPAPAPAPKPVDFGGAPNPSVVYRETFQRTRDPIAASKAAQAAVEAMISRVQPSQPNPFVAVRPEADKTRALRSALERAARNAGSRAPARGSGF